MIKPEGPYRPKPSLTGRLMALVIIVMVLIGFISITYLDKIMTAQRIHDKTLSDAMDQLMWIQMDLDLIDLQLEQLLLMDKPKIVDSRKFTLSEDERHLIERICMAEARGGGVEGMAAVAQTIRNRAELWGYTIKEVCLAPSQYASPSRDEITPEAAQAVWAIFDEGLEVVPGKVTHFHSEKIAEPYWTKNKVSRGSVGGNRFYGGE